MRRFRAIYLSLTALVFFFISSVQAATVTSFTISPTSSWLTALNQDWPINHESYPLGVPTGYDWYYHGRIKAGNTVPDGFTAFTGWGQVFRTSSSSTATVPIQFRNMQVYVCYGSSHTWVQLQQGGIAGAAFAPDFVGNVNQPATITTSGDVTTVQFALDTAFHFWPSMGRADIPSTNLCGFLVLTEARLSTTDASQAGAYVFGFGIDYWKDKTAQWLADYSNNKDVGVGRMKKVGLSWAWYGLSTASDTDLQNLYAKYGATISSPPSAPQSIVVQQK